MLIAWLKIRQRTLVPILEGNGWAINGRVRINLPLGSRLTQRASLPPGTVRRLDDPYVDRAAAARRRTFVVIVIVLLAAAAVVRFDRVRRGHRYVWQKAPSAAPAAAETAAAPLHRRPPPLSRPPASLSRPPNHPRHATSPADRRRTGEAWRGCDQARRSCRIGQCVTVSIPSRRVDRSSAPRRSNPNSFTRAEQRPLSATVTLRVVVSALFATSRNTTREPSLGTSG
jgi:hypothetical protein